MSKLLAASLASRAENCAKSTPRHGSSGYCFYCCVCAAGSRPLQVRDDRVSKIFSELRC